MSKIMTAVNRIANVPVAARVLLCMCGLACSTAPGVAQHWTFSGTVTNVANGIDSQACLPEGTPPVGAQAIAEYFAFTSPGSVPNDRVTTVGDRWYFGDIVYDTGMSFPVGVNIEARKTIYFGNSSDFVRVKLSEDVTDIAGIDEPIQIIGRVVRSYSSSRDCGVFVDFHDVRIDAANDVTGDGVFNSDDLVTVLASGQYEDGIPGNSSWATGDWSGDGDFDNQDLVLALQRGNYEDTDDGRAAVPEASSFLLLAIGLVTYCTCCRRTHLV